MDEKKFLESFKNLLLIDYEISLSDRLTDLSEWDSFSYVAFTAMAEDDFDKILDASEVRKQVTVGDLFNLFNSAGV